MSKIYDLYKIKGEYKNPKFKPWTAVDPEKELKTLLELIKSDNEIKGIEEMPTCVWKKLFLVIFLM